MTSPLLPWAVQCSAVSLGALVFLRMVAGASAHVRRAAASVALLSFLVPPLARAPFTVAIPGLETEPTGSGVAIGMALGIHFVGVGVVLWLGVRSLLRNAHELRGAVPIADGPLHAAFSRMCADLRIARPPGLMVSPNCAVPCVSVGIPTRIVLPSRYLETLDLSQLRLILAHELIHVRQGDLRWGWVRLLVCSVWWFHPMAWIVARAHRNLGELCCDATLLTELDARPVDYANSLVEAAQLGMPARSSGLVPALLDPHDGSLQHRLRQIARRPRDRWSSRRTWLAWATALALLPLAIAWFTPPIEEPESDRVITIFHHHRHSHSH